jgi:uncharacterized protein YqeY
MTVKDTVSNDLKTSMKEKNTKAVSILRVLKAELDRAEQGPKGKVEITQGILTSIVKKLIEGIKETTNDQVEISILDSYLPKQLTEADMLVKINELKASGIEANLGAYMKAFKTEYEGQYDAKVLSNLVKSAL